MSDLRMCKVGGKKAVFHKWEEWKDVVAPSLLIGGANGGQVSRVYGIIEFSNGTIKRVNPTEIKFTDGKVREVYEKEKEDREREYKDLNMLKEEQKRIIKTGGRGKR